MVYGDAFLFKLLIESPLEVGGPPPTYLDLDLEFVFGLEEGMSLARILRAILKRLAEEEDERFLASIIREPDYDVVGRVC